MKVLRPTVAAFGFVLACTVQGCGCGGGDGSPASTAGIVEETPFAPAAWTKLDSTSRPTGQDPAVIKLLDGTYRMWYRVGGASTEYSSIKLADVKYAMVSLNSLQLVNPYSAYPYIGMSQSKDGLNWDKPTAALVGVGGEFDSRGASGPCVLFDGKVYRMWYQATDDYKLSTIAYAESADGITWSRKGALFSGSKGMIDEFGVYDPHVTQTDASSYRMLYTAMGADYKVRIASATSKDGIAWTKDKLAVLEAGQPGAWDAAGVYSPSILFDGVYRLWYVGAGAADKVLRIGYAESPDGLTWTKFATPVLDAGAVDSFDQYGVSSPFVLKDGSSFRMWYAGKSLTTTIGCATNP